MVNSIFLAAVKNREHIITLFKLLYLILFVCTLFATAVLIAGSPLASTVYDAAYWAGRMAIVLYVGTLVPGIARRFGIQHKLIAMMMIFRRYIGMLVYLLVLFHFMVMRGTDWFFRGQFSLPVAVFIMIGLVAHDILLAMFLTSNDLSTKRLGPWWNRLHSLTYIAAWLIFLHVALQRVSIWTIIMGIASVVLVASFVYSKMKKRQVQISSRQAPGMG